MLAKLRNNALSPAATNRAVGRGVDVAKAEILGQLRSDVPSMRLRNVGKNGAKVDVFVKRVNVGGQRVAQYIVGAKGPWQLFERGTKAHYIVPRGVGGSRASRLERAQAARGDGMFSGLRAGRGPKALHFGGQFRAYTYVRGVRAKHTWARGVEAARPKVPKAIAQGVVDELVRAIR